MDTLEWNSLATGSTVVASGAGQLFLRAVSISTRQRRFKIRSGLESDECYMIVNIMTTIDKINGERLCITHKNKRIKFPIPIMLFSSVGISTTDQSQRQQLA